MEKTKRAREGDQENAEVRKWETKRKGVFTQDREEERMQN